MPNAGKKRVRTNFTPIPQRRTAYSLIVKSAKSQRPKIGGGVKTPRVRIKPEALAGVNKRPTFQNDNPLTAFTPRELMQELHNRGYEGELSYTARINIANM